MVNLKSVPMATDPQATESAPLPLKTKSVWRLTLREPASGWKQQWVRQVFLTVVTFGIYFFWAQASRRQALCARLCVDQTPLEYRGTGKTQFYRFLKWVRIFGTLVVILEYGKINFLNLIDTFNIALFFTWVTAGVTAAYFNKNTYLSEISWKGISIVFQSKFLSYLQANLNWTLLSLISIGLLLPVRCIRLWQIQWSGLSFEGKPFEFDGELKPFVRLYLRGLLFSLLSFGIYWSWHRAALHNYQWNHVKLGQQRFRSVLNGVDLFWLNLESGLMLILSLGLAWPWVQSNRWQMYLSRMAIVEY